MAEHGHFACFRISGILAAAVQLLTMGGLHATECSAPPLQLPGNLPFLGSDA